MKKLFSIFFIITFPQYFTQKENEKKKFDQYFMCGRQCSLNENKKLSGLLRVSGPDAVHHNRTSPPPKIDLIRGRNYKIISSENSQLVSQNLTHTEPEPDMGVTKEQVESSLKSKMNPSHLVSPNSFFFFF